MPGGGANAIPVPPQGMVATGGVSLVIILLVLIFTEHIFSTSSGTFNVSALSLGANLPDTVDALVVVGGGGGGGQ